MKKPIEVFNPASRCVLLATIGPDAQPNEKVRVRVVPGRQEALGMMSVERCDTGQRLLVARQKLAPEEAT